METFNPISASAVHVLARLAARKAVQEELRAQGVRPTLVKPAEISARANEYLGQHPELWRVALERAQRMAEKDELRKAQRRKSRHVCRSDNRSPKPRPCSARATAPR